METANNIAKKREKKEKINWIELKNEYIMSDYGSVMSFLKAKDIGYSGGVQKKVLGWADEKKKFQEKVFEKVQEKRAKQMAEEIVKADKKIQLISMKLLNKIDKAIDEVEIYMTKHVHKNKTIAYDYQMGKPNKEVIFEEENYELFDKGIVNAKSIRDLSTALKDLKEIGYSNIGLNIENKAEDENKTGVVLLPNIKPIDEMNSEEVELD